MIKKLRWQEISSGLFLAIVGGILLFKPKLALLKVTQCFGLMIAALGIIFLLIYLIGRKRNGAFDLAKAIVVIVVGLLIFTSAKSVVSFIPKVFGGIVALSGLLKLQRAFEVRKMKYDSWIKMAITALFNILIGLLVVLNPFETAQFMTRIIGVCFLFSGITDLVTTLYVSRKSSQYYKEISPEEYEETDEEATSVVATIDEDID